MNLNDYDFLKENITALTKKFPTFKKDILDRYSEHKNILFSEAQNSLLTAKIDNIWIHSSRRPDKEAEKLIKYGIKSPSGLCLVFGFGLGYHIEALLTEFPKMNILIIEPEPEIFLEACKRRKLSTVIKSNKVGFLLDTPVKAISGILKDFHSTKIQTVKLRSMYSRNKNYYNALEEEINNFITKMDTNKNTLNRFGKLWTKNLYKNTDAYLKAYDCGIWFEKFIDMPSLVIAAGPSLENLLPILPKLYDQMIIICVDTALRAVIEAGVIPDFVVVVDPQYLNSRHIDGLLSSKLLKSRTALISESSTHPSIFRNCLLPIYFFKSLFPLGKIFDKPAGITSKIGAGGSVATTAWDFSSLLGCNRIYSIGLDLGYPEKKMHCRNSLSHLYACLTSNRLKPMETINFCGVHDPTYFYEVNNQNEKTLTDKRLTIYSWWFKSQIETKKEIEAYNLSKYGIKIKGMKYIEAASLDNLPKIRPQIELIKQEIQSDQKKDKDPEDFLKILFELLKEFNNISRLCKIALKNIEILENINNQSDDALFELKNIDQKIAGYSTKEITGFLLQPVLEEFTTNDSNDSEKSYKLYSKLLETSNFHISHAKNSILKIQSSL